MTQRLWEADLLLLLLSCWGWDSGPRKHVASRLSPLSYTPVPEAGLVDEESKVLHGSCRRMQVQLAGVGGGELGEGVLCTGRGCIWGEQGLTVRPLGPCEAQWCQDSSW